MIGRFCSNPTHTNFNTVLDRPLRRAFFEEALKVKNQLAFQVVKYYNEVRGYHNSIKAELISKWYGQGVDYVMDLGSGKGGDLLKYGNTRIKELYCVEPNPEFIQEMIQRNVRTRFKMVSINAKAQEMDVIQPRIRSVNGVSMFFSLSFFFESGRELDALVSTVQKCTLPDALFIGTTIDGSATNALFERAGRKTVRLDDVKLKREYARLEPRREDRLEPRREDRLEPRREDRSKNIGFGKRIRFVYKESATVNDEQVEYLVDFDEFVRRLGYAGFSLIESIRFDPPPYFRPESIEFSKLYRTFVFRKDRLRFENAINSLMTLANDVSLAGENIYFLIGYGAPPKSTLSQQEWGNVLYRAYPDAIKGGLTIRMDGWGTNEIPFPTNARSRVIDIDSYVPTDSDSFPDYKLVTARDREKWVQALQTLFKGREVVIVNYVQFRVARENKETWIRFPWLRECGPVKVVDWVYGTRGEYKTISQKSTGDAQVIMSSVPEVPASIQKIKGLRLIPSFVTKEEETELIAHIDAQEWSSALSRRVQQYGYEYSYKGKAVAKLGELPEWLNGLVGKLLTAGIFDRVPTQVIINEYLPGQGINAHTDHKKLFGDVVCSLSLLSEVPMVFARGDESIEVPLLRRSLVVLTGDARYEWTHCIEARKRGRSRRVSITFRNVA
jgi:alkylated DNA repair dioxygenase AlkB